MLLGPCPWMWWSWSRTRLRPSRRGRSPLRRHHVRRHRHALHRCHRRRLLRLERSSTFGSVRLLPVHCQRSFPQLKVSAFSASASPSYGSSLPLSLTLSLSASSPITERWNGRSSSPSKLVDADEESLKLPSCELSASSPATILLPLKYSTFRAPPRFLVAGSFFAGCSTSQPHTAAVPAPFAAVFFAARPWPSTLSPSLCPLPRAHRRRKPLLRLLTLNIL